MKKVDITPEEIDLIKKAQAGSKLAFSRLFKRYKPFVDSLLYTYIKDKDEARDITNVVFLKVHEKLSSFTNYHSFGGWLRILTKNVAIDYLRTTKDLSSLQETLSSALDEGTLNMENSYINKMTYDTLVEMIDKLSPPYRDSCYLFYVENLTIEQIAASLNIPIGTIKSNLSRGRKILRNKLKLKKTC